jgi:cupin superfamily acireductone dioxygenase involved in methionine salvage
VEASDAEKRVTELEELADVPGTYFNPQTEVLVVVDDSSSMDQEIFNLEEFEGADWVLISDDMPVDEAQRDEMMETFQARHHGGDGRATGVDPETDEPIDDDEEEQPQGVEELE